jgi:hypothetical protein
MFRRGPVASLVALAVSSTLACASTSYAPRAGQRLTATETSGEVVFARDGRTFERLDEAVAGNAAAEAFAIKQRRYALASGLAVLGGIVLMTPGIYLSARTDANPAPPGWQRPLALSFLFSGEALFMFSMFARRRATANFWDAFNVYNDASAPAVGDR